MTTTAPRGTKQTERTQNGRGRRWPLAAAASAVAAVGLLTRRRRNGGTATPTEPPPLRVPRRGTARRPIWSAATARATITARHLRTDRWWVQPLVTVVVLLLFVAYSTFRAFQNAYYFSEPYISPFYSPCITTGCQGDTFPLVFQNVHRYFFYFGLVFNVILTYDAVVAFRDETGAWGHMGVGTLVLLVNAILLWLYSLSCHSCRHIFGGRLNHFSRHPVRYRFWTVVSKLNTRHMQLAWVSLFGVALTDLYVYLVAADVITDVRFF